MRTADGAVWPAGRSDYRGDQDGDVRHVEGAFTQQADSNPGPRRGGKPRGQQHGFNIAINNLMPNVLMAYVIAEMLNLLGVMQLIGHQKDCRDQDGDVRHVEGAFTQQADSNPGPRRGGKPTT
jgi:hypothetical protein